MAKVAAAVVTSAVPDIDTVVAKVEPCGEGLMFSKIVKRTDKIKYSL